MMLYMNWPNRICHQFVILLRNRYGPRHNKKYLTNIKKKYFSFHIWSYLKQEYALGNLIYAYGTMIQPSNHFIINQKKSYEPKYFYFISEKNVVTTVFCDNYIALKHLLEIKMVHSNKGKFFCGLIC